ncbi:MAG: hypothetical protein R3D80_11860 [Paracoccaceae bacterium]
MFGNGTLRDNWNTQWGPEPVLSLCTTEARKAPITLAGLGSRRGRAPDDAGRRSAPVRLTERNGRAT